MNSDPSAIHLPGALLLIHDGIWLRSLSLGPQVASDRHYYSLLFRLCPRMDSGSIYNSVPTSALAL